MIKLFYKKVSSIRKTYTGFNRYFFNTSWLLIEKIVRSFIGLFLGTWMARYLGPEGFGKFNYIESYVLIFTAFSTLGLDSIVIRELVKDHDKKNQLLGTAFTLKLIGAILMLILISFTLLLNTNSAQTNLLILILSLGMIFQSFNVIDFYFQSQVLSQYVAYAKLCTILFSTIFKSLLLFYKASLFWIIIAFTLDFVMVSLGFIYFYFKNGYSIKNWIFDASLAKELLRNSLPLTLSAFIMGVYSKMDQIMITEMLGEKSNGYYSLVTKLTENLYFIPIIITDSLFPAIILAKKKSDIFYYGRLKQLATLLTLISIAIITFFLIFSKPIILLLYGEAYEKSIQILNINAWFFIFIAFLRLAGKWYVNEGLEKRTIYNSILGIGLNLLLNYIFILKYGVIGASFATLISYFCMVFIFDLFFKENRKLLQVKINGLLLKGQILNNKW